MILFILAWSLCVRRRKRRNQLRLRKWRWNEKSEPIGSVGQNIYVAILQASIAPFPPPPIYIMKHTLKHTPLTLNTAYINSFSAETRTQGRWGLGKRWGHWVYSKDFWRNLALNYAITKLLVTEINSCFCFVSDGGGEKRGRDLCCISV